jgi:hypothetical protein
MWSCGPRPLTAAQQFIGLQTSAICAGTGELGPGRLVWRFEARPTLLSRAYKLRLVFAQGGTPQVFVPEPDLTELAEGRRLPHVYEQKPTRLCLYLPRRREWNGSMRLAETVVPWAILWLFYFEEWLASNAWKGGGIHPNAHSGRR